MKPFWQFSVLVLGPGIVLLTTLVTYTALKGHIFGGCDAKFGCGGLVLISTLIGGLALLCSSLGHAVACAASRNTVHRLSVSWLLGVVLVLSLGQGALLFASNNRLLPGNSLASTMGSWVVISTFMALVTLAVACRWLPGDTSCVKKGPKNFETRP